MKKILLLFTLTLFMYSCGAAKQQLNDVLSKVYIGMPISEFNQLVETKELISMEENSTIYLVKKFNWYDHNGADGTAAYRYFYFKNNKLSQVDEGERVADLKIKIEQ